MIVFEHWAWFECRDVAYLLVVRQVHLKMIPELCSVFYSLFYYLNISVNLQTHLVHCNSPCHRTQKQILAIFWEYGARNIGHWAYFCHLSASTCLIKFRWGWILTHDCKIKARWVNRKAVWVFLNFDCSPEFSRINVVYINESLERLDK